MTPVVILNPNAGGGRGKREWPHLAQALTQAIGAYDVQITAGSGDAARVAREAADKGAPLVVAIGGDGTINEVVNGLMQAPQEMRPSLGIVNCGTGGDLRRTLGLGTGLEATKRLASGATRALDVGCVDFTGHDGAPCSRYFVNIASFGLSGLTDRIVNRRRGSKIFGGKAVFMAAALAAVARYKSPAVRIDIDGIAMERKILTVAVCNGRYFGGGMQIAPAAEPDDGLFDVVVMGVRPKLAILGSMQKIYTGAHLSDPGVFVHRGCAVTATPVDPGATVLLDIDGEDPGRLPARFSIIPAAMTVRC